MVSDEFARHLETLYACRACPNVIGQPVTGAVANARVMLVGQAPGPHEVEDRRPFAYTAGRRLFSWFVPFGVPEEKFRKRIHIAAVIRCFPGRDEKAGGDRVPSPEEIARCGEHLDREIAILKPKLVIAVGTLASAALIGVSQLKDAVGRVHRVVWRGSSDPRGRVGEPAPHSHRFDVVVLPHPSGRSTWLNKKENAAMLEHSLQAIVGHPAWRATFRFS
jgi:uracil-DNA glycosylase